MAGLPQLLLQRLCRPLAALHAVCHQYTAPGLGCPHEFKQELSGGPAQHLLTCWGQLTSISSLSVQSHAAGLHGHMKVSTSTYVLCHECPWDPHDVMHGSLLWQNVAQGWP